MTVRTYGIKRWLRCMILVLLLGGCTSQPGPQPEPTSTPTASPTATPTPEALLQGWTTQRTQKFEILVPEEWITVDFSSAVIDAIIAKTQSTNPASVPYLEALRRSDAIKFAALNPAVNGKASIMVSQEIRLTSLEQYANLLKKQAESLSYTITIGDKVSMGANEGMRVQTRGSVHYPSGEPAEVQQELLIVDKGADRYVVAFSYLPQDAEKYKGTFESVTKRFRIFD